MLHRNKTREATMSKAGTGRYFEDFFIGQRLAHATPRTLTTGDAALYAGLYGSRFAVPSSAEFARAVGYAVPPLDELLVFHVVFGKTVPDVSLNAVANLGYADLRFVRPVSAGDTLTAASEVIGLKQTSSGETGIVWVRTIGSDQHGRVVVAFVRWVLVKKRDRTAPAPDTVVPQLPSRVDPAILLAPFPPSRPFHYDPVAAGSPDRLDDYAAGERIDHVDGVTVEEAEHQMATRLYQNTARVHFNAFAEAAGKFGARLVYGGHVISMARALTFNGLANAFALAAINAGRHAAPVFAGDTIFAWSEVKETAPVSGRDDIGLIRLRTVATKNEPCPGFPGADPAVAAPNVVLDLDYWAFMPR
jgi:2-methylfumaryl-CoA hydratase